MRAALGEDGAPAGFDFSTAVGSITRSLGWGKVAERRRAPGGRGLAQLPIPQRRAQGRRQCSEEHACAGDVLALGRLSQNAFAVESFIDEWRMRRSAIRSNSGASCWRAGPIFSPCSTCSAEKGDWGKPLPKGVGRGIAIHEAFGTIVGEIAEVAVSTSGEVKVERVVAASIAAIVVNPRTVEMQIESGVIYGLTAALFGEITIKDGRVEQGNFDTYPMVRMADAPGIETHFALSGGDKWGGIGEPGTPPIAPAMANAIFAATGKRIRALPLKNASLGV